MSLNQVAREALEAGCAEYVSLVENTIELLASEKGTLGNMDINGRLVRVQPHGRAIVSGDLHGDLESLVKILRASGFIESAEQNKKVFMIFLGDYGDRGPYSPEVYYVVLRLKQRFPKRVILMRGNHEGPEDLMPYPHDLPENLQKRFGEEGQAVYSKIRELFSYLYNALVVQELCVMIHGGVPSQASSLQDLMFAHVKHPKEPHLEEMLWSDPKPTGKGVCPSPRGAGKLFGENVTDKFLEILNVRALIRGHEPAQRGFKIDHNGKVLTLFSRKGPPYFNSSAAYLEFDMSLKPDDASKLLTNIRQF